MWLLTLVLVAGLLSTLGGLAMSYFGIAQEERTRSKGLKRLRWAVIPTVAAFICQFLVGVSANRDAAAAEHRADATLAMLNGGNTFCYVRPWNAPRGELRLAIARDGDAPMYDVQVSIINMTALNGAQGKQLSDADAATLAGLINKHVVLSSPLTPGTEDSSSQQLAWPYSGGEQQFLIDIFARNGHVKERLVVRDNHFALVAYRTDKHDRAIGKVLKLHVDHDFPGGNPFPDDASALSMPGVITVGTREEAKAAGIDLAPPDLDVTNR